MPEFFRVLVASLFLLNSVLAIGTNDQVNAPIDYGTFKNPSSNVRPRWRYWVPDASIDLATVAEDVASAGKSGAGGVELLGYYFYGEEPGDQRYSPVLVDWAKYGWGTPAWKNLTDVALEATKDSKLVIDLSMGPNQGAGVPAPVDSAALQYNLILFNVSIPLNGSFDNVLPGWGSGKLVAAVTALVTASGNSSSRDPSLPNDAIVNRTQITLSSDSLKDVTSNVDESGRITFTPSADATGLEYILFAFFQNHTEYREQETPEELGQFSPQSPVTSYRENGSWVVDHFSPLGANAVIDFWSQYLLGGNTKELIKAVGNYLWEDSQEFGSAVYIFWTDALPKHFQQYRSYSLLKYLPILFHNNNGFGGSQFARWYITDEDDGGESHVADYRQSLLELNRIYLDALREWSNSLGVQLSTQVGYNLPADMEAQIPSVNAPECETLDFSNDVDSYRQFAGPANLAGKRIVSSELGANAGEAYRLTISHLLWHTKRSFSGSINNFVLHGLPYSGDYPNTTWPGFTTFDYSYSDMHGRHQPGWDFYPDFMDWVSRNQYITQSGVPKMDIAFWLKVTNWAAHQIFSEYPPNDLQEAGYSYEYLSPDDFALPEAYVKDKVFAPNRQAFKALIVRANESLTVDGTTKLYEYAQSGLPILFPGGMPTRFLGANKTGAAYVNRTLEKIKAFENARVVPEEGLAATLSSLGVHPRTSIKANATWYTVWREDEKANKDYIFIYNDAVDDTIGQGYSTGTVTFATSGQPYHYDAWTGDVTPIIDHMSSEDGITIAISLAGNQTTIIGFHRDEPTKTTHSNTTRYPCGASFPVFSLDEWTLIVESWTAPSDIYDLAIDAAKSNKTYHIQAPLTSWRNTTDELRNVSGRGYYSSSFTWPPSFSPHSSRSPDGAILDLGAIVHTARANVNGYALPPLDVTRAEADIGRYLKKGKNEVQVVVSTPLGNALRPLWDKIHTSGKEPPGARGNKSIGAPLEGDYGLVLPVWIKPYYEGEV